VTITAIILFPLTVLKNLDALKYTSFLGLSGVVYCAAFMLTRYLDQSYLPEGKFFNLIAQYYRPKFDISGLPLVSVWLLCFQPCFTRLAVFLFLLSFLLVES
jgi:amino acid permease